MKKTILIAFTVFISSCATISLDNEYLSKEYFRGRSEISEITASSVREIYIKSERLVESIEGIQKFKNLKVFFIDPHNLITDVSPLAGCVNLEFLSITAGELTDISMLKECSNIKDFSLDANVKDVSVIENFQDLKTLSLNTPVLDISWLTSLQNLEDLYMLGTFVDDISVFRSGFKDLKRLEFSCLNITSLRPLLENPNIEDCYIKLFDVPLDEDTIENVIPALETRGNIVNFKNEEGFVWNDLDEAWKVSAQLLAKFREFALKDRQP